MVNQGDARHLRCVNKPADHEEHFFNLKYSIVIADFFFQLNDTNLTTEHKKCSEQMGKNLISYIKWMRIVFLPSIPLNEQTVNRGSSSHALKAVRTWLM